MNQPAARGRYLGLALAAAFVFTASLLFGLGQAQAAPTATQQFAISIGDTVSDGVPTAGAGNLEEAGGIDIYTFAAAGEEVIFNWVSGSNVQIGWQLQAPDGTMLFNSVLRDWQVVLSQTGVYTLTVDGNSSSSFGLYAFELLETPPPQQFVINIGDTVSDGFPASGAGNLEAPGAVDIFTFSAVANQELIFNWLSGSNVQIGWQLEAPDSTVLFDSVLRDWQLVLPQTGVYTLTANGNALDSVGLYSFQLLEVTAVPQQFTISFGDTISEGIPAPGAGNIETPGAIDIYTFDAQAGQTAVFDWLTGNNTMIRWQLQAPNNTVLFDNFLLDQQVTLAQTGSYTLTVRGADIDDFGTYSFALLEDTTVQWRTFLPLVIR